MSQREHLRRLTWAQWRVQDSFSPEMYTMYYTSVYEPTWRFPHASLLIRITNGGGSIFQRFASLEEAQQCFVIPGAYIERLQDALAKGRDWAEKIQRDMRNAMRAGQAKPGEALIKTPEGELIAEAERIIGEGR